MACEVCGKSYIWNTEDDNFDSDAKPHVCTTCGQSFSLKIQLKRHTLLHANGEPYVCVHCSKTSESKSYNLRLSKKSDKYPCDICGESFSSKRMLLRHSAKEHENDDSVVNDSESDDDYGQPKKRKAKHYRKGGGAKKIDPPKRRATTEAVQEQTNKRFVCTICFKRFAYQTFLDRHVRDRKCAKTKASKLLNDTVKDKKSGKDKKHVCNVCGKGFTRKSSLEGHELTHVKERFDSTPEEDNASSSNDEEEKIIKSDPKPKKIKIQKSYTCDHCNYVCFSKPTLDKHLANHKEKDVRVVSELIGEEEDRASEASPKETHTCEFCYKAFHSKGRLKRHLVLHFPEEEREGAMAKWGWSLPTTKHKRSKDYSCEVCGKQFAGLTCLHKHSLKHGVVSATTNEEVRRPPKKKKEGQPMECQFCHEVFTGKRSVYVKHLHSHTPEVCGICDQRFVDRASLREHCRVHVGTEEGRIFMECSQKALDAKNGLLPPEPKVEYIYLLLR